MNFMFKRNLETPARLGFYSMSDEVSYTSYLIRHTYAFAKSQKLKGGVLNGRRMRTTIRTTSLY